MKWQWGGNISKQLSEENLKEVDIFLKDLKPLLLSNQCEFKKSKKNEDFNRYYPLTNKEKIDILKSLSAKDCIKIENNTNPMYIDARVFFFIKECNLIVFGEEEIVKLYIKLYIYKDAVFDNIIVISFHKDGMYE